MHKLLLPLLFSILLGTLHAQDTLLMKNGERILGKVIQVGKTIQFRKQDNPDGPIYTAGQDEVRFIHFKNGLIDTIRPSPIQLAVQAALLVRAKIERTSGHYSYNNKLVSEHRLFKLLKQNPPGAEVMAEMKLVNNYRRKQMKTGIVAASLAAVSLVVVVEEFLISSTNRTYVDPRPVYGACVALFASALVTEGVSILFRSKRLKHGQRMVELYNQEAVK